MNDGIGSDLLAGIFQILAALSAVGLKYFLDSRKLSESGVMTDVLPPALFLALVGAMIGATSAFFGRDIVRAGYDSPATYAEIIIAVTCLLLAFMHFRSRYGIGAYVFEITAIWLAFVLTWLQVKGGNFPDFAPTAAGRWLGCAAIGAALIYLFRRAPAD